MFLFLNPLRELSLPSVMLRLVLAMLFGGLIGLERGRRRRPAGFRTYMLVCLGAALTMLLGQYDALMLATQWSGGAASDVSRFGAQVINGIGFLGAGTILVTPRQQIKGLTTAAGLWASACMGLAIGAAFYECILPGFVLIFLSMRVLPRLEASMIERARNLNIYMEFTSLRDVSTIVNHIKAQSARIYDVELSRERDGGPNRVIAVFNVRLEERQPHTRFLSALSELECVYKIDEI